MSKLSQLKQDAYQAGKDRNWGKAISVYEEILEIDKKNPTLVNELGDVCLKANEVSRGVRYFLNAASLYRKNGLVNNAVAIYKKILRHDAENMSAHWYLAESRAGQGLKAEGLAHVFTFLDRGSNVAGDLKEIYLKRCLTLLDLYHDSGEVLEKLIQVFRMWEMFLEAGRAEILVCCLKFEEDPAAAQSKVEAIVTGEPTIVNYPEYSRWRQLVNPQEQSSGASPFNDFGSVDLGASGSGPQLDDTKIVPAVDAPTAADETSFGEIPLATGQSPVAENPEETSFAGLGVSEPVATSRTSANETSFGGLMDDEAESAPATFNANVDITDPITEKDEDGCITIDTDASGDLSAILAAAVEQIEGDATSPIEESDTVSKSDAAPAEGTINLLDQILADGDSDILGLEDKQLETISAEISTQIGDGSEDQADRQYEIGLVYLDMGMLDQAITQFQAASKDAEYAARAFEMWSMTLEKDQRNDEAIAVLRQGKADDNVSGQSKLGLLYHLGKLLAQNSKPAEAEACYKQILQVDPDFLDVGTRCARLSVST